MKNVWSVLMVCVAVLVAGSAFALTTTLEPVVVTATRVETPLSEIGSSVTVITSEEIESKQAVHLIDVLRGVPGLDVVRNGGLGQQASVFLRGANSDHTLVLVDGIEVNDPSTPARAFDFASLSVDNIERIEIVRGPGSTLYGSDAMGGVINIITRKGVGDIQTSLSAEAGSFRTHQEKVAVSGGTDRVNYSIVGSYLDSEGITAAGKEYGNSERDGYTRKDVSARVGLTPADGLSVDFFYRYLNAAADLDNYGGTGGDDPNYTSDSSSNFFKAQAQLALFDSFWEQSLGYSLTDYDRSNKNGKDIDHPDDSSQSQYDGQLIQIGWQHNLNLSQSNILTLGAEYEEESMKSRSYSTFIDWVTFLPSSSLSTFPEKSEQTVGYYLQDQIWIGKNFVATGGLRIDDHSQFGTHDTYSATVSYFVPMTKTRFKGSYGTGFKTPTLSQLYENSVYVDGNPSLSPEKSEGWDVGFEQILLDERVTLGATWFETEFDDLILAVWNGTILKSEYLNIDAAKTSGLELTLSLQPVDGLIISGGYTYTKTENVATGEELLRRPRNKYNVALNYQLSKNANMNIGLLHVGEREDYGSEFPWPIITLKPYTVVNLAASYAFTDTLSLTGRIENLLDEEYEEVSGYGTPGIAGYLGARLTF